MIIAVDVDGVVADLHAAWLDRYNDEYNGTLIPAQITEWDITQFVSCTPEQMLDYIEDPTIYDEVGPIDGALSTLRILEKKYDVVYVTTSTAGTLGRKYDWLQEHGFLPHNSLRRYVECADKSLIRADVLIDDGMHNLMNFAGKKILFGQPWNASNTGNWKRPESWQQIYHNQETLLYHPTEFRCPQQVFAFRQIIEDMYQTHLDKNADYSPANILGTGEIGLVTRLWDKIARLMNLYGFHMNVESSSYELPRTPKGEAIDDTLLDAAVYSVIGMILRRGDWGK